MPGSFPFPRERTDRCDGLPIQRRTGRRRIECRGFEPLERRSAQCAVMTGKARQRPHGVEHLRSYLAGGPAGVENALHCAPRTGDFTPMSASRRRPHLPHTQRREREREQVQQHHRPRRNGRAPRQRQRPVRRTQGHVGTDENPGGNRSRRLRRDRGCRGRGSHRRHIARIHHVAAGDRKRDRPARDGEVLTPVGIEIGELDRRNLPHFGAQDPCRDGKGLCACRKVHAADGRVRWNRKQRRRQTALSEQRRQAQSFEFAVAPNTERQFDGISHADDGAARLHFDGKTAADRVHEVVRPSAFRQRPHDELLSLSRRPEQCAAAHGQRPESRKSHDPRPIPVWPRRSPDPGRKTARASPSHGMENGCAHSRSRSPAGDPVAWADR